MRKRPEWWYSGFKKGFFKGYKTYIRCWLASGNNPYWLIKYWVIKTYVRIDNKIYFKRQMRKYRKLNKKREKEKERCIQKS